MTTVLRRALLVALLWLTAWAAADRVVAYTLEPATATAGMASCRLDAPGNPDTSDRHWDVGHRTIPVLTESIWKSLSHQAGLARLSRPEGFDTARGALTHDPPRHTSPHLHSIPLLI